MIVGFLIWPTVNVKDYFFLVADLKRLFIVIVRVLLLDLQSADVLWPFTSQRCDSITYQSSGKVILTP